MAVLLAVAFAAWTLAPRAKADTAPPSGTPATVSDDSLPTVQINGVVWSQVVVGNTVYATGSFSSARPAGSKLGTNETPRGNLLAFDLTTGDLITTFNHTLNAQGRAIIASPDGSRVYVGGEFTKVDGLVHNRIAAFSTATGALLTGFTGSVDATVYAITATNSVVYAGGALSSAGANQPRSKLAAFDATTGALTTWNPGANDSVTALTMSPDKSRVVVGGHFTTLGGQSRYGLGAVDSSAGAATTWTSTPVVMNAGPDAAITSLSADNVNVYGTGYVFGSGGNTEGRFAINPNNGNLVWINDCHGDTYSAIPIGQVLYSVSHAHYCGNMGAFPEDTLKVGHHALAETTYPTCTLKPSGPGTYFNFGGEPCSTQLDWYPDVTPGTYTGQSQAAWSVAGNSDYVVLGGEFPRVNGVAQQGLARFAIARIAPNKMGPVAAAGMTPTATRSGNNVNLAWDSTWDPDNGLLTYRIYRDGGSSPVASTSADTRFWTTTKFPQSFTDLNPPDGTHTYKVVATDFFGNALTSAASNAVTTASGNLAPVASSTATCAQLVCTFNATGSRDPDGSIASYAWSFGDGTTGTGSSPQHRYSTSGSYLVALTVTDNRGAKSQQLRTVSPSASCNLSAPVPAAVAVAAPTVTLATTLLADCPYTFSVTANVTGADGIIDQLQFSDASQSGTIHFTTASDAPGPYTVAYASGTAQDSSSTPVQVRWSNTSVSFKYLTQDYIASSRVGTAVYLNGLVHRYSSSGMTSPSGVTVYLQRYLNGSWQTLLSRVTSSGRVTVGFIQPNVMQYRWVTLGTATILGANSVATTR
jgi:PKD repeat protein